MASETLPDQAVEEKERAELVHQALSRLPEQYRVVVVLRHYEGLKFREIAGVLGIPGDGECANGAGAEPARRSIESGSVRRVTQFQRFLRSPTCNGETGT